MGDMIFQSKQIVVLVVSFPFFFPFSSIPKIWRISNQWNFCTSTVVQRGLNEFSDFISFTASSLRVATMLEYKLLNCYLASPFSIAINISSLATDPSIVCAIAAYATQRYSSCLWQWALTLLMCMLMGLPWRGQLFETKTSPEQAELLFRDGCRRRITHPGWRWCCILGERVYGSGYKAAAGHLCVCV